MGKPKLTVIIPSDEDPLLEEYYAEQRRKDFNLLTSMGATPRCAGAALRSPRDLKRHEERGTCMRPFFLVVFIFFAVFIIIINLPDFTKVRDSTTKKVPDVDGPTRFRL